MNRPINTLNADRRPRTPPVFQRFAQEIALILGGLLLLSVFFALASHSMNDSAWSTTGLPGDVANWLGSSGAVFADAAYYVLGFSVWWLWLIGLRQWLAALARWLRSREPVQG
ncbi:MAG: DNA translocase FtsK 4TM domain-containing protein, partial [Hydrogenophaga sp.]|nr:DNA translocase FtsK 4TM domain-containing protein [Hydrogenophaga sp.]